MAFISYAQNFEDVLLHRALRHIDKGSYIDVGANDPVIDSVTKSFYDAGWRGINLEPVGAWFEKLQSDRPGDINLKLAAGASDGKAEFFEVVDSGLSTMVGTIAERHAAESGFKIRKYEVPLTRLTTVCEQNRQEEIHFLKIDAEGAEQAVIEGLDLERFRPWIILLETSNPNTKQEEDLGVTGLLLTAGYENVYYDGLNRFFVANEHEELKPHFCAPPNVFDNFKISGTGSSIFHQNIDKNQGLLTETERQNRILDVSLQVSNELRNKAELQLNSLQSEWARQVELLKEQEYERKVLADLLKKKEAEGIRQAQLLKEQEAESVRQNRLLEESDAENIRQSRLLEEKEDTIVRQIDQLKEHESELLRRKEEIRKLDRKINKLEGSLRVALAQQELKDRQAEKERQELLEDVARKSQRLIDQKAEALMLAAKLADKDQRIARTQKANEGLKSELGDVYGRLSASEDKVNELNQISHNWWLEAEKLRQQLDLVYQSLSWKVAWPLRKALDLMRLVLALPGRFTRWVRQSCLDLLRWSAGKFLSFVRNRPGLQARSLKWQSSHPALAMRLMNFFQPDTPAAKPAPAQETPTVSETGSSGDETDLHSAPTPDLSPYARRILKEIETRAARYESRAR